MNIERRITFVIGQNGFASWQLNRLKALTGFFRSVVILQNITTGAKASTDHVLKILSLGTQQNHLCQLRIEGSDAELACMILTDFVVDQFEIVNTTHKCSETRCHFMIENHLAFRLPFAMDYYCESLQVDASINKYAVMAKLSRCLNIKRQEDVLTALLRREAISATGIGHGIALPHIIIEGVESPSLVILQLDKAINWESNLGDIRLIIGLLIPAPANRDVVSACTKMTRSLLDADNCHLLTTSPQTEVIKAIVFHFMARDMLPI